MDGALGAFTDPLAGTEIDGLVCEAMGTGIGGIGGVAIGDQQRLGSEFRQQLPDQLGHPQCAAAGDGVDGWARHRPYCIAPHGHQRARIGMRDRRTSLCAESTNPATILANSMAECTGFRYCGGVVLFFMRHYK